MKLLISIFLVFASLQVGATTVVSSDQGSGPQIQGQTVAGGRIAFTFCFASGDCQTLGSRKYGYTSEEVSSLGQNVQAPRAWRWLAPGNKFVAQILNPDLATANGSLKFKVEIEKLAEELNRTLDTLPSVLAVCPCRSSYPSDVNLPLADVPGKGIENWQAHMNAQYNCQVQVERTAHAPTLQYPVLVPVEKCKFQQL